MSHAMLNDAPETFSRELARYTDVYVLSAPL